MDAKAGDAKPGDAKPGDAKSGDAKPRIVLQNVRKEYDTEGSRLLAVDDVSLSIGEGEFISFIGPSGCGKTTILNMIAGFQQPSSGTIALDGKAITAPGPERGVIFQDYGVFPWLSVKDNICFGPSLKANYAAPEERARVAQHYIDLMGLRGFENAWPKTLSGGMRQRVALARAYAVKSEFLLMDEPFGALDAQTRSVMQDLLLQVLESEGKTVALITHSVDEALYLSNRVVVITARPARIKTIIDVPFPYQTTPRPLLPRFPGVQRRASQGLGLFSTCGSSAELDSAHCLFRGIEMARHQSVDPLARSGRSLGPGHGGSPLPRRHGLARAFPRATAEPAGPDH